jgi:predicted transcriptional regulator
MQLKPQDFLVALKLVAWGEQRWTYARLAQELGISVSEAHGAVKRGLEAGLLLQNRPAVSLADAGGSDAAPSVHALRLLH